MTAEEMELKIQSASDGNGDIDDLIRQIMKEDADITRIPKFDVSKTVSALLEYKNIVNSIVLCKDCKYLSDEAFQGKHWCKSSNGLSGFMQINDGCSRGERRYK